LQRLAAVVVDENEYVVTAIDDAIGL